MVFLKQRYGSPESVVLVASTVIFTEDLPEKSIEESYAALLDKGEQYCDHCGPEKQKRSPDNALAVFRQ